MHATPISPASTNTSVDFNSLDDDQVVALLRSGEQAQLLRTVFGDNNYQKLRKLARSGKPLAKSAPRVYLLPGLMGSRLGTVSRTRKSTAKSTVWLDLAAVASSDLLALALPSKSLQVLGAMLPSYLKLKLSLRNAGFNVCLHAYDWRRSVVDAATALMKRIVAEQNKHNRRSPVMLIGHSMGGLVARAALSQDKSKRISKVIQLGAPNFGSFAPVQAFRAVYPSVRKLATLDPLHSAEQLSRHIFRTLPGLYQLLPAPERTRAVDFFNLDSWPNDLLGPDATLLAGARAIQLGLSAAHECCHHIVGVNQQTVVRVSKSRSGFVYHYSADGDGTVPRTLADWPGAKLWYVEERHGNLACNDAVCAAVIELINTDTTRKLKRDWQPNDNSVQKISDSQLRRALRGKISLTQLPLTERQRILEPSISAEFLALAR